MGLLFESDDVRCPKNVKTSFWGLFKWLGYHNLEVEWWSPWKHFPDRYELTMKCKRCGATVHRSGVSETMMIQAGIIKPAPHAPGK